MKAKRSVGKPQPTMLWAVTWDHKKRKRLALAWAWSKDYWVAATFQTKADAEYWRDEEWPQGEVVRVSVERTKCQ